MTKDNHSKIEVFQELYLGHPSGISAAREAVLNHLRRGWIHQPEREQEAMGVVDVGLSVPITLARPQTKGKVGVSLWMFQGDNGRYRVSNIVPLKQGELGITGYNEALSDFIEAVVKPAADESGLVYDVTPSLKSIDDWADQSTALVLKRFSNLANKSTGHSHPMDNERWIEFLLTAHQCSSALDSEQLRRWLSEVEKWPFDTAMELASEYDLSRSLLAKYDRNR